MNKAKVINKESEYYKGEFRVLEILDNDRMAVLYIDGKKVDFGMSEIEFLPSSELGKEIQWRFSKYGDSVFYDSSIKRIAKRAAEKWKQKLSTCVKSLHMYQSLPESTNAS